MEKSILRSPESKQILIKIEHQDTTVVQQIRLTNADGTERRQTFTLKIGATTINTIGGLPARSRAQWEGQELVIESWMKGPDRQFHFKDYWSLAGDRQTLKMAHRDDDLAGQITLLEKLPQAEAAEFDGN